MNLTFVYLSAFSSVGGIQRFNKLFLKALNNIDSIKYSFNFKALSLHDSSYDELYVNNKLFFGCGQNRIKFLFYFLKQLFTSDCIIIGHINLYIPGLLCLLIRRKFYIISHGIEVWENSNYLKNIMLKNANKVLCVSHYTKDKLIYNHGVKPENINVIFNTIDPEFAKKVERYQHSSCSSNNKNCNILLSVCRLSSSEKYKGYDKVIESLPEVKEFVGDIKYFIVGKWDSGEIHRVKELARKFNVEKNIEFVGQVSDEELVSYYKMADIFVMPSKGEGFGIVFLEALYCGLPVIAGNKDGSVEPLMQGDLGLLVDPDSTEEIGNAIVDVLKKNISEKFYNPLYLKRNVIENFGFEKFKTNLQNIILN